jgi:hypothetical protein
MKYFLKINLNNGNNYCVVDSESKYEILHKIYEQIKDSLKYYYDRKEKFEKNINVEKNLFEKRLNKYNNNVLLKFFSKEPKFLYEENFLIENRLVPELNLPYCIKVGENFVNEVFVYSLLEQININNVSSFRKFLDEKFNDYFDIGCKNIYTFEEL